jgi:hypothetical protein
MPETSDLIAEAVAQATETQPVSHGVARAIAEHYMPTGRAPNGRAVYRKALKAFIASGEMQSVNNTPTRWVANPRDNLAPPQAVFDAASGEGQWARGSDTDKSALAAFGDYLQARASREDFAAVPNWRDLPVE